MVPSATANFEQRRRVRNSWGGAQSSYKDKQVFFFLGTSLNTTLEEEIIKENDRFGDIVQADFLDTYHNLTYKTLSMLYWAHYRMADGRFGPKWIFKCDDDNFMDIFQFETYLHTYDKLNGAHILCSKREEAVPSRIDKNSTWFVDFDTWPEPLWPPCCFGPAYVMTPAAVSRILQVHEEANNPFLPFEDIYITGVLARAADVSIINFDEQVFTNYLGKEKLIIHKGLSHWNPAYIENRWTETAIAALGNATYQALKAESLRKATEARDKALVRKRLVDQKRNEFFSKQKNQVVPQQHSAQGIDKANDRLKIREETLKKPGPYLFKK